MNFLSRLKQKHFIVNTSLQVNICKSINHTNHDFRDTLYTKYSINFCDSYSPIKWNQYLLSQTNLRFAELDT